MFGIRLRSPGNSPAKAALPQQFFLAQCQGIQTK